MIVQLTAPCSWHRAVLNCGEVVDLPDAVARQLVIDGQAKVIDPILLAAALDGPPANKLMKQKAKKAVL